MATQPILPLRQIGNGTPILIIHGWTMSSIAEEQDFGPILRQRRSQQYRQIYVDLPGMGGTPIGAHKDLDAMLASLCNIVENHIPPTITTTSNFLLIGTSCGAYLARALAYKYADRIDGLLLRVPVIDPLASDRDVDAFAPVLVDEKVFSSVSDAEKRRLGDITVHTPEYISALKRKFETVWKPAFKACDAKALEAIQTDPQRYMVHAPMHSPEHPFVKPVLVVTGRQDTDVGFRDARKLAACFPRATVVALDRAHHGFPVDGDDRELFEGLVQNWLGRVEEVRRARAVGESRQRSNI